MSDATGDLLAESVRNITKRSIPKPQPPVGGNPCSRLRRVNEEIAAARNRYDEPHSRVDEGLVNALCFVITLLLLLHLFLEAQALFKGVVQLGIGVAELFSTHEALKSLAETWARSVPLGERGHDLWVAHCESSSTDVVCVGV